MKPVSFFFAVVTAFFLTAESYAGETAFPLSLSLDDISIENTADYSSVNIRGGKNTRSGGVPSLPSLKIMLSIPATSRIVRVRIEDAQWEFLGIHDVYPAQNPYPYGSVPQFQKQDDEVYQKDAFYPEEPLESFWTGNKSGFMIGCAVFCPFRYNPVSRELYYMSSARIVLQYEEGLEEALFLTQEQMGVFKEDVLSLVWNPEAVDENSPFERLAGEIFYEYIVIAPEYLSQYFENLLKWKTEKGVRAGIFTKEWITQNYAGYDDLEKMREFVKDYHRNHGLIYLVLVGDYENLGARMVPVRVGTVYFDNAPSDMYFSDVVPYSSNWDANGNRLYGEFSVDGCDWFADVYVGRFPVTEPFQVTRYIEKVLTYEMYPLHGYLERSLQGGGLLWPNYNHYGSVLCDSIADNRLPVHWSHTKMYESFYSHPGGFNDSLSRGYGWCHIASHGSENGTYWYNAPADMLTKIMADALINGMKIGVIHSIACEAGWFDQKDCLAEHLFNAPNGGAVASIFNSRYGWGQAPGFGSSDFLGLWTAEAVFTLDLRNIGRALSAAKDKIIFGTNSNPMRDVDHWCMVELNLFGDPETQIYSREPSTMIVNHPPRLTLGNFNFIVSVYSGRQPLTDATCCLSRTYGSEVWFMAKTGIDGVACIPCSISDPAPVIFTVYAKDYFFYRETLQISSNEPYVALAYIDTISGGYENGEINPACSYAMTIAAVNYGTENAIGVRAYLSSDDSCVVLNHDTVFLGDFTPGDTLIAHEPLTFSIAPGVFDRYNIPLNLVCYDSSENVWMTSFFLGVNAGVLDIKSYHGPSEFIPGHFHRFGLTVENSGSGTSRQVEFTLRNTGNDPFMVLIDSTESLNIIQPGISLRMDDVFEVSVASSCVIPHFSEFELMMKTADSNIFCDTFTLAVGSVTYQENFESSVNWTFSGPACWHVTTRRFKSQFKSMYCGSNAGSYYDNMINARTISEEIFCTKGSTLSFWHFYSIQQKYDGCRVEYSSDGGGNWLPLSPMEGYTSASFGFGGFYYGDSFYSGNRNYWAIQNIVVPQQGFLKFSWRFGSDSTISAEGYYFDDVSIRLFSGTGAEEGCTSIFVEEYLTKILSFYPNPTSGRFFVKYSLVSGTNTEISVFDLSGRKIAVLVDSDMDKGTYIAQWDGRDERGELTPAGTYFFLFRAGEVSEMGKFILIR